MAAYVRRAADIFGSQVDLMYVETISPRPLGHRVWVCAIGLSADSERVLRVAHSAGPTAVPAACGI
jgi:hypothetical protein